MCENVKQRKVIGHLTHSEDLEGTCMPQYLNLYEKPQDWIESKSHNFDLDKEKTKRLFTILTKMKLKNLIITL